MILGDLLSKLCKKNHGGIKYTGLANVLVIVEAR